MPALVAHLVGKAPYFFVSRNERSRRGLLLGSGEIDAVQLKEVLGGADRDRMACDLKDRVAPRRTLRARV